MKRRILSVILTVSMLLSMPPATAWAEGTELEEAAETVFSPDDGEDMASPGDAEVPETTVEDTTAPDAVDAMEAPEIAEETTEPSGVLGTLETAVTEVQALIGALPAAEEVRAMDRDSQRAAYDRTQAAYDAYMALSEEQRGLITGDRVFEQLFAFFNGQTAPLADQILDVAKGNITITDSGYTQGSSSGKADSYTITGTAVQKVQTSITIAVTGTLNLTFQDLNMTGRFDGDNAAGINDLRKQGCYLYINSGNVVVTLQGKNLIEATQDGGPVAAVRIANGAELHFKGNGEITIHGSSNWGNGGPAVENGKLYIEGGTVKLIGGKRTDPSNGAFGKSFQGNSITVNGGNLVYYAGEYHGWNENAGSIAATDAVYESGTINETSYASKTILKPEIKEYHCTSVTLKTVDGVEDVEYRVDSGSWQSSPTFNYLTPLTTHTFYQRIKVESYFGLKASEGVSITLPDHNLTGTWTSNGYNRHYQQCSRCNERIDEDCYGGQRATYFERSVCEVCHAEYGNLLRDYTSPTGEIKLGNNTWGNLLSTITFELFFKDTQTLTVTATDDSYDHRGFNLSNHAVKIEYYADTGSTALTEAQLKDKSFIAYSSGISLSNDGQYTVYAKLTDWDKNISYISSNGIVVDKTPPVIGGIQNGSTYYISQAFTVTDTWLDEVRVDGKVVTLTNGQYTLGIGDHTVTATDKAGNSTTVNVTVARAAATITKPNAGAITYGQKLSESALTGGKAMYSGTEVPGTFQWTDGGTIPPASNDKPYSVTFTPNDLNLYEKVTVDVPVAVKPRPAVFAWDYEGPYTYQEGITHRVAAELSNIVGSDTVTLTYEKADGVNANTYTAKVIGIGGANGSNYTLDGADRQTLEWEIKKAGKSAPGVGIDYFAETLTSTDSEMCYRTGGGDWTPCSGGMPLKDIGYDDAAMTARFYYPESSNYLESEVQTLDIPARPEVPDVTLELTKTDTSITVKAIGTGEYEYSIDGVNWINGEFSPLDSGKNYTVYVRTKASANVFASCSISVTVATANSDGSTSLRPGETAKMEGGTITNNGSDITLEDNNGNTTTVTPPEGTEDFSGGVQVDSSGNVVVPGGSTATPEGGPDIVLGEQGGAVDEEGNVTLPGGGSAGVNGDTVTAPEEGGTLKPDGKGGVDIPGGSTVTPPGGPEITVGPENGGTVDADGNVTLPDGGSARIGDTTVTVPERGASDSDGEGGEGDPDEGAPGPDEGDSEEAPGGGTLKPDGKGGVKVPDGSTVTPPCGEPVITVEEGGIVDKDGNVSFPEGGSARIGDTVVTVPEGGTIMPNGDGTVNLSPGTTVTDKDGNESTVSSYGGKLDAEGNYTANAAPSTPNSSNGSSSSGSGDGSVSAGGIEPNDTGNGGGSTSGFTRPAGRTTKSTSASWEDEPDSPALAFSDLDPNAWYWDAVDYMIRNGLMNGYGDGTFGPGDDLSRAMLAQILYNTESRPNIASSGLFTDVPHNAWYTDAVTWAAANGIAGGYGNGQYGPDDSITREQLAVMLYRYEQSKGGEMIGAWVPQINYTDTAEISDWAREAMGWCTANGIVEGKGNDILDPKGKATRAEVAAMLMRFLLHLMGK